eukprot:CAMPEP_0117547018 /NCGR_PEP_ID=MMETSP0784-20121206/46905_1 /TAXON_ID=39447 /ORGANISM="" /LENGTH=111 /DNA_ID=CAMNT_0005343905 /DNA_START=22 /DNA_END=354 /DNA_ORIENTATION=+
MPMFGQSCNSLATACSKSSTCGDDAATSSARGAETFCAADSLCRQSARTSGSQAPTAASENGNNRNGGGRDSESSTLVAPSPSASATFLHLVCSPARIGQAACTSAANGRK